MHHKYIFISLIGLYFITNWFIINCFVIEYYLGKWYQVYISPNDYTKENYSKCITIEYLLNLQNDLIIQVKQNQIDQNNIFKEYIYFLDLNQHNDFNYKIIKLGNIIDKKYEYSIATNKIKSFVTVLVRNLTLFNKIKKEINDYLFENNIRYVSVNQIFCNYNFTII